MANDSLDGLLKRIRDLGHNDTIALDGVATLWKPTYRGSPSSDAVDEWRDLVESDVLFATFGELELAKEDGDRYTLRSEDYASRLSLQVSDWDLRFGGILGRGKVFGTDLWFSFHREEDECYGVDELVVRRMYECFPDYQP